MEKISLTETGDKDIIKIYGRFTFSSHQAFLKVSRQIDPSKRLVVDLFNTSAIDSSALGMLLRLRGLTSHRIHIINATDDVLAVLKVAAFNKIFDIN